MSWPNTGRLYSGVSISTAFSANPTSNNPISTNHTLITKIGVLSLLATGTNCRITIKALSGTIISATYIGLAATTGNAWSFNATPTQITWAGSNSITMGSGGSATSDLMSFVIDKSKAVVVAFNVTSGGTPMFATGLPTTPVNAIVTRYFKPSSSEASTVAKPTGYTTIAGTDYLVSLIEVS